MIEKELRFYLKTNLKNPTIDFKWSEEDNSKFFDFLSKNCANNCLKDINNQQKIKAAFKDYFQDVGYLLFKMNERQLRFKIFPYKIEPKDSVNLSALMELIDSHEDMIEDEYNGKENQTSLPKELKNILVNFVNKITNEEINKKELLRYAVSKYFNLDESDIVLIRNDQIFIKIFNKKHKRDVSEDEKNTIANRYNGIDEQELKSFYDDFFLKQNHKDFFQYIAKTYVEIYMLENKIDNYTYEKNVFADIQSIVVDELINMFEHNDDFLKGFSGYVFRLHFKQVFGYIANLILDQVSILNDYMVEFLKYYSSNVIVHNGKRYKVPDLETEDGLRWNVVSMLSVVKLYTKTKITLDDIKMSMAEIEEKIKPLYIGELSPLDFQTIILKERDRVKRRIAENEKKLERAVDSLETTKSEQRKETLKNEVRHIKEDLQKSKDELNKLSAKMINKNIITQYNNFRKDLDDLVRQAHRQEKLLAQNEESYLSIKNALAKALVSKRKLVG